MKLALNFIWTGTVKVLKCFKFNFAVDLQSARLRFAHILVLFSPRNLSDVTASACLVKIFSRTTLLFLSVVVSVASFFFRYNACTVSQIWALFNFGFFPVFWCIIFNFICITLLKGNIETKNSVYIYINLRWDAESNEISRTSLLSDLNISARIFALRTRARRKEQKNDKNSKTARIKP